MISGLIAALTAATQAVAAKLTAAGIASGVVMYKAVKPNKKK